MAYYINPLKELDGFLGGSLKFGQSVHEVRGIVGGKFKSFVRGARLADLGDRHPSDIYPEIGVICYFDIAGNLEAVEFSNEANVVLAGKAVFDFAGREAISFLKELDNSIEIDADGATSYNLSLGIWAPEIGNDEYASVESFLAGRAGYYDVLRQ